MARKTKKLSAEADLFSALDAPIGMAARNVCPTSIITASVRLIETRRLAEVAVEGPVRGTFTYLADGFWERLTPGARVLVPFGGRTANGFFVGEKLPADQLHSGFDPAKLKSILKVLDIPSAQQATAGGFTALLTPTLLELARWMSRHYAAPLGSTLSAMLPAGVKRGAEGARIRMVGTALTPGELVQKAEEIFATKPRQAALLLALAAIDGAVSAASLLAEADAPDSALKALQKAGWVKIAEERPVSDNFEAEESRSDLKLNEEQQTAFEKIEAAVKNSRATRFLLQGVTGSGKTEIYLRALKTVLALGKQAIVLVPEIALTPQTAQRFESRLGRERVAVLHSHVTDGDRAEAWRAIRDGKIDVVVGARSALFAPLPRLGIIVIDEEHESAFKQESTPRYHARDVAMELARLSSAVLVLGSATPSFEALYAARKVTGDMWQVTGNSTTQSSPSLVTCHLPPATRLPPVTCHLHLTQRVAGRPMPPVEIIDMNRENQETKRYSYLSRRLLHAIEQTLSRGEQTILFMNRRGFATVLTCVHCGHTEKCEQCDITLTSHRSIADRGLRIADSTGVKSEIRNSKSEILNCHYCGFTKPVPDVCALCGSPGVKHWGMGTERVENEVRKAFPSARVARMDSDTMTRRTAYLETLGNFRAGKTDILVGTQMIAKGLDFPNVTLVGVVMADTALHMPDFRSRERTFQLLAQVAGRAGRSEKGGRVLIQTHLPNDPAIRAASTHDFETFSLNELRERRTYNYPPFTRLARILIRGKDQQATRQAALAAAGALRAGAPLEGLTILGPAEPAINRLEGYFRQHILIKAATSELLSELLSGARTEALARLKGADAVVDVDALSML